MGDLKTPKGHFEINWPLAAEHRRARSKTLDFLQILRKEKVGKARILNYLCSFDVLSQEIAATAAVRTSLWSKGCKFEHKKIFNVKVKGLSKVVGHKENLEKIPKFQHRPQVGNLRMNERRKQASVI